MENIIIKASETWEYFNKHKEELKTTVHIIAENEEYNTMITLTEDRGFPLFTVNVDGERFTDERAISAADCEEIAEDFYEEFLTEKFLNIQQEESLDEQEDMIESRESELDDAVIFLLDTITEADSAMILQGRGIELDKFCEELKDFILEHLARKYNMTAIRRPMILEDEDTGEDFFTEYPYECMVYDEDTDK